MKSSKGIILAVSAAALYGVSSDLTKIPISGGISGISIGCIQYATVAVCCLFLAKVRHLKFRREEIYCRHLFTASMLGCVITCFLLYSSYALIPLGSALCIHYIYPILASVISALFFRQKPARSGILALAVSFIGILQFFDGSSREDPVGLLMALLSGFAFAVYLVYIDHTPLRDMNPFLFSFGVSITYVVIGTVLGLFLHQVDFSGLTASELLFAVLSGVAVTGGQVFMLLAIKELGAATYAVFAPLEPIIGTALGILLLHDPYTWRSLLGGALVLVSICIVTVARVNADRRVGP
jgi:drug/metabolite transporter (DMT)-like permease